MQELSLTGEDFYDLIGSFFADGLHRRMKIQCRGTSMSPFVKDKCTLCLAPVKKEMTLRVGDIVVVALHQKKQIIIHRVIAKKDERCLVKGDNNTLSDGWFHKKDILGIVETIEQRDGLSFTPNVWKSILIATFSKHNVLHYVMEALRFLQRRRKRYRGASFIFHSQKSEI